MCATTRVHAACCVRDLARSQPFRPLHALPGKGPGRPEQAQGFWYHWGWAPPMAVLICFVIVSHSVPPRLPPAPVSSGAQLLAPLQCSRFILSETQSRIAFEQHHQGGSCLFCRPTASPPSLASPRSCPAIAQQLPSNCPAVAPGSPWQKGLSITTTKDKEFKYTYIHIFFL